MKIVVLAGGLSTERDVSITSGCLVSEALRKKGHKVVLLDVFMGYEQDECDIESLFESNYSFTANAPIGNTVPDIAKIKASRKDKSDRFLGQNVEEICKSADITFLALHGDVGENGKLQATLDLLGIKYTGSGSLGSALAMDKGISKSIFLYNNVPTPKGSVFVKADNENGRVLEWNSFPCVVKPCSGGSSVGVSIVRSCDEYESAMKEAFKYEDEVLVEQFVKGRELSVGLIDGKALPIIEIVPKQGFYDYINKYQPGSTDEYCPADICPEITQKIQREAEHAYKVLKLDAYARIDFILADDGSFYCLEANTLPGMTPTSLLPQEAAAVGIDYPELCDKLAQISLEKYN